MALCAQQARLTWVSYNVNKAFILAANDHLLLAISIIDQYMHLRDLLLGPKLDMVDKFEVLFDVVNQHFAFVAANIEIFADSTGTKGKLTFGLENLQNFQISRWKYDQTVSIVVDQKKFFWYLIKECTPRRESVNCSNLIKALFKRCGDVLASRDLAEALRIKDLGIVSFEQFHLSVHLVGQMFFALVHFLYEHSDLFLLHRELSLELTYLALHCNYPFALRESLPTLPRDLWEFSTLAGEEHVFTIHSRPRWATVQDEVFKLLGLDSVYFFEFFKQHLCGCFCIELFDNRRNLLWTELK